MAKGEIYAIRNKTALIILFVALTLVFDIFLSIAGSTHAGIVSAITSGVITVFFAQIEKK